MQHRTPSPNTQSGTSVKIRAVFNVLSIFFGFYAPVSYHGDAPKKKKPSRHRRITTAISGLGVASVRFMFKKAEIQARTSVFSPSTLRSRRARPVSLVLSAVLGPRS